MEHSVALRTPAKVNLSLDILGKRNDGYHFLKTVMQSVSIYDEISVTKNNSGKITVKADNDSIPADQDNIAYKAAEEFFKYSGHELSGIDIFIEKGIPSQAGLGGGSSDAAAVLIALNELTEAGLSSDELCEIGENIGADVPFFVIGGTVLAEGIGEILTPLPDLPEDTVFLIAKPKKGVSTAEAYNKFDTVTPDKHPDHNDMVASIATGDIPNIAAACKNVLEQVADIDEISEIAKIMKDNNALCSIMSGSGSAVFGIFEKKRYASSASADLKQLDLDFLEICYPEKHGSTII